MRALKTEGKEVLFINDMGFAKQDTHGTASTAMPPW